MSKQKPIGEWNQLVEIIRGKERFDEHTRKVAESYLGQLNTAGGIHILREEIHRFFKSINY